MTVLILTPEQARAVVGSNCDTCEEWGTPTAADRCDGCPTLARFIPADSADAWPVGVEIDVQDRHRCHVCYGTGGDGGNVGPIYEFLCEVCEGKGRVVVGRVRLGEPVPVNGTETEGHVSPEVVFELVLHGDGDETKALTLYDEADEETDITRPLVDLFPDIKPGMVLFPIVWRGATT